jgi:hypothetical protein
LEILKGRGHLVGIGVDGRIILKCIFEKGVAGRGLDLSGAG